MCVCVSVCVCVCLIIENTDKKLSSGQRPCVQHPFMLRFCLTTVLMTDECFTLCFSLSVTGCFSACVFSHTFVQVGCIIYFLGCC